MTEIRLYHWTAAALSATKLAYALSRHIADEKGWGLEVDYGVERHRDADRTVATDQVRLAQTNWVPGLNAMSWHPERDSTARTGPSSMMYGRG